MTNILQIIFVETVSVAVDHFEHNLRLKYNALLM